MASQTVMTVEAQREGADIFTGSDRCQKKSIELLEEFHLPRGLLPLSDMEEVGHNRSTGFVWLRQKKKTDHTFKKIGKVVSYAPEVTAIVENGRMKRMTGVKTRELLLWLTLTDMFIEDPASGKITFKTPSGIGRSFPVTAFEEVVGKPEK